MLGRDAARAAGRPPPAEAAAAGVGRRPRDAPGMAPRSSRPASISPRGSVDLVRVIIITACCVVFLVYYVDLGRLGR